MDFKDYYATLGLEKTASEKDIKQAFRKLARKYHPDVNPGDPKAEARFKEVNEAHEVLSDPEKRRKYDELGANWRQYESAGPGAGGPAGGWNWQPGAGGGRPLTEEEVAEMFGGGDSPFSDFFQTFFGGGGRGGRSRGAGRAARGRHRDQRGEDVEHEYAIDLESAAIGSVHRLTLRHDGEARHVEVRIPAGVTDGSRVRVAGEGTRGSGSAASGDLFLRIRLKPHPLYQVTGRDLTMHVSVPVATAVLGGEVNVVTLTGRSVRVKVPETTQPGLKLRLRGMGLPGLGDKTPAGDLYVIIDVALPRSLDEATRKAYEALARLDGKE